jgi:hypothetical protein
MTDVSRRRVRYAPLAAGAAAALVVSLPAGAAPVTNGLQQWYAAGSGVFTDTAGATAAANGSTVGRWTDLATDSATQGGTQNASQADPTKAATYVTANSAFNSNPSLHFVTPSTGTAPDAFLSTAVTLPISFTIFVVAAVPDVNQTSALLGNARPTAMAAGQWVMMTEGGVLMFRTNGVQNSTPVTKPTNNKAFVAAAWSPQSGEVDTSLNGGPTGVNTNELTTFTGATGVGGVDSVANPPRTMNGDISEVLIYNTSLSAADRQATLDYLGTKYNITVAPEPASAGLIGVGAAGLLAARRRRRPHG